MQVKAELNAVSLTLSASGRHVGKVNIGGELLLVISYSSTVKVDVLLMITLQFFAATLVFLIDSLSKGNCIRHEEVASGTRKLLS